jgi:hypothetical protein
VTGHVLDAIRRGEAFLRAGQDADGFWRDYRLTPGPSEAWTTAVVGCTLAAPPGDEHAIHALHAAIRALADARVAGSWGYNRYTSADADSTAWCIRFVSAVRPLTRTTIWQLLQPFIDSDGDAHTIPMADAGTWGEAHADVTPVVGLALVASGAPEEMIRRVRGAVLRSRTGSSWPSFWWPTDLYATARALEFLDRSGGIPGTVSAAFAAASLSEAVLRASPFELAHAATIARLLRRAADAHDCSELLLAAQESDGGWPASAMLAVPSRETAETAGPRPTFPDERRLMTTSMAVAALKAHAVDWRSVLHRSPMPGGGRDRARCDGGA